MRLARLVRWALSAALAASHGACRWCADYEGVCESVETRKAGPRPVWPREGSQVNMKPVLLHMPDWREKYAQVDLEFEARTDAATCRWADFLTFDCAFVNAGTQRVRLDGPCRYAVALAARQVDDRGTQQSEVLRLCPIVSNGHPWIVQELILGPGEKHCFEHTTQLRLPPGRYLIRLEYHSPGRPHEDAMGWQGELFSNVSEVEIVPRRPK